MLSPIANHPFRRSCRIGGYGHGWKPWLEPRRCRLLIVRFLLIELESIVIDGSVVNGGISGAGDRWGDRCGI